MEVEFIVIPTEEASQFVLDSMFELVKAGDQIHLEDAILKKNIKNSKFLAFCSSVETGFVVGCAAIKVPQKSYLRKVFERAKAEELQKQFEFEIGYCYTSPNHEGHGICTGLIQELMEAMPNTNFFATTKHSGMRHLFHKFKFKEVGDYYYPPEPNAEFISLHVFRPDFV